jgi:hypothetical protein
VIAAGHRAAPRIRGHIRSNAVGYVAVFLALSGTATALSGSNTVFSDDIVDDQVHSVDVRDDSLTGGGLTAADLRPASVRSREVANESLTRDDLATASVSSSEIEDAGVDTAEVEDGGLLGTDIANASLTGADISEASLAQVPAALRATLGGTGRSAGGTGCDPESLTLIVCAKVTLDLAAPSRVLVIGQILGEDEVDADQGAGSCELGTSVVDLPSTSTTINTGADGDFELRGDNATMVGVTPVLSPGNVEFRIRCNQSNGAIVYFQSEIAAVALSPS